ncbi:MAG: hypothetical protein EOO43_26000, partial [Flavobacterium sp.]
MRILSAGKPLKWTLKLRGVLTNTQLLSFIIPVMTVLLLRRPLSSFLSTVLVDPILSKIQTSVVNDIIFALLASYIFLLFVSRFKQFVPSVTAWILQLLLASAYFYYRLHPGAPWLFHSFFTLKQICYADLLFEVVALNSVLIARSLLISERPKIEGAFYDDTSLGKDKPDKLGYEPYVKNIIKRIDSSYPETAIAIGINGKWGSGKTSFFDLMRRSMLDDAVITVNFDPWNSLSPNAIIKDFFNTIQVAMRPYHSQLP